MQDWAEIRRLHRAEGMPIRQIARVLGISRNTVRSALAADGPTRYARRRAGSVVDAVEPQIRELLALDPRMPSSVIARRIGWARGMTVLRERVAALRPTYLAADGTVASYQAGELAQCDLWFPDIGLPVGCGQKRTANALPVLVMTCAWSRWVSALLIPSRAAGDLYAGWWRLIGGLGACPRTFLWDSESAVGRWRRGRSELTEQCRTFRDTLGARVVIRAPTDPHAKEVVEEAIGQLRMRFLRGRRFGSPGDFNHQLTEWLAVSNGRIRPVLGYSPADRIVTDRAGMLALPASAPPTGSRSVVVLGRDHYVRVDGNDYSVHARAAGHCVEVISNPQRVQVLQDGRLVADHPRVWARDQVITAPEHTPRAHGPPERERRGIIDSEATG